MFTFSSSAQSVFAIILTTLVTFAAPRTFGSVTAWITRPDDPTVILRKEAQNDAARSPSSTAGGRFFQSLSSSIGASTIVINPDDRHQVIEGFGAALTEASVANILKLPIRQRMELMHTLFNPTSGAGLNLVRVPMGSSDLADGSQGEYTYDDSPGAVDDPDMKYFSMARDLKTLRLLRVAKIINPDLKIMINPWTAPPWMKDNKSFYAGGFESKNMEALARYFIRTIDEYRRHGLEVDYVGIQNEPGITIQYPSMYMSDEQQAEFIRVLGQKLKDGGSTAKIIANDDNYIAMDRVKRFLSDAATAKFIGASAFHCWSNDPERLAELPGDAMSFETECGGNINSSDFSFDFNWWHKIRVVDNLNRGLSAIITWNMVSDEKAGPWGAGPQGCKTCRGLVVVRPTENHNYKIEINSEFAALMHASKFIKRGAVRLESRAERSPLDKSDGEISSVVFRNPDGKIAVLLNNWSQVPRPYVIKLGDREIFSGRAEANQATTLVIDPRD
jgi:glucosylceramidase